ncbi:hypothetical protein [Herbidospora sp. NBRC 101105]|uniref:hypothetical protein n=1 Tax=Herbidospora sp. NBRC 101105 TaxID=3032195 RepID=UPI0024A1623F|nr:hypothetical protein [Herbidospora sp. NBRC 101105]GLX98904.1 hypothetical protein Hesp01_68540 [Herbidospora sp. NBRC 101105]
MSLLRTFTKPIREVYNNRDEITQKVKDLPMLALQGALSGVGQALLLGDRVRTTLKRVTGNAPAEETPADPSRPGVKSVSDIVVEEEEEKKPRREPVIFAPRPAASDRPEPVIFQPGGSAPKGDRLVASGAKGEQNPASGPEETREPVTEGTQESAPAAAEDKPLPHAATDPAPAPAPEAAQPPKAEEPSETEEKVAETADHEATTPAATPEATEKAKEKQEEEPTPVAAEPQGQKTTEPSSDPALAAEPAVPSKIPPAPKPAKKTPGEPVTDTAVPEVTPGHTEEAPARDLPAEPIPGYADLTFASLRARMRGRSKEEIQSWIDYEKASTARPEVLRMFENRLAKLEN